MKAKISILRYSRVRAPRNFSVPRPVFNCCTAGKRRWFALREKRRRLALPRKVSSMIVLWHSIAFENIMMVDEVPVLRDKIILRQMVPFPAEGHIYK